MENNFKAFQKIIEQLKEAEETDSDYQKPRLRFQTKKELLCDIPTSLYGDFYTPKGVAECLATLIEPFYGTAYDPSCGSGALLKYIQVYSGNKLKLSGQTIDEQSFKLTKMNLASIGTDVDLGERPENTLLHDQHKNKKFDFIISNPPFNSAHLFKNYSVFNDDRWAFGVPPCSNANFAWLQHIISHMNQNGRAAVIMPNSTLTTRMRKEAEIRKGILKKNLVEAIITLPSGLFYSTKVPCCVWLLTNTGEKRNDILLVDATHITPAIKKDFSAENTKQLFELIKKYRQGEIQGCTEWYGVVPAETIAQNEFQLSPNLYTAATQPHPSKIRKEYGKLTEITDELSALLCDETILSVLKSWKNAETAKTWNKAVLPEIYDISGGITKNREAFGKGTPLLEVKNVIHSPYLPDNFSARVEATEEERMKYSIQSGDVLLNRTSKTIKELACCCVSLKNSAAVYGGFIKRLRPWNAEILNPLYASCYFRSEIYRWEIEKVSAVYTVYASMNNAKLSKISIYYPDAESQSKIGQTLFTVFQYRNNCKDENVRSLLKEFEKRLIQQYITYPILCIQNKEEKYKCI